MLGLCGAAPDGGPFDNCSCSALGQRNWFLKNPLFKDTGEAK